ncbi:MAG TPA: hypothetical protein VFW11_19060 [Cyclobacteriaceae bacterium]|nr:hypothetical protein [Cyclobacteriaceae bacterium]
MESITDEFMQQMLAKSRPYEVVILKTGPNDGVSTRQEIVWEHVRRNFELRAKGVLSIVCPVFDSPEIKGIGIFNVGREELKKIMDEDPGVKSGIFIYEILSSRSFPGDALPA